MPYEAAARKFHLALIAIRFRSCTRDAELGADIWRICEDVLQGMPPPEPGAQYDVVRIDGTPAFEVQVRAIPPQPTAPVELSSYPVKAPVSQEEIAFLLQTVTPVLPPK